MKQILVSALVGGLVAAAVSLGVRQVLDPGREGAAADAAATTAEPAAAAQAFSYTDELIEDGWVARAPGADHKPLADASNSICYLTKIEIKGVRGPDDANSCTIGIDDFTGFWQVTAAVGDGGTSEVRCNARCLVWE